MQTATGGDGHLNATTQLLTLDDPHVPHPVPARDLADDACDSIARPIALTGEIKLRCTHRTIGDDSDICGCFLRPKCSGDF